MKYNLHSLRKISNEIQKLLASNVFSSYGISSNVPVSVYDQNPVLTYAKKVYEQETMIEIKHKLIHLRKRIRDTIASGNNLVGIDSLISEKKYINDLISHYNLIIEKAGSNYGPVSTEETEQYFSARKEVATANGDRNFREFINIPAFKEDYIIGYKNSVMSLKKEMKKLDEKILQLNLNTFTDTISEEDTKFMEELGIL